MTSAKQIHLIAKLDLTLSPRERSPYANRIRLMWVQMRQP